MNKEFTRTRSARDLVLSIVLVLAGLACILVPSSIAISILGCFITIIGIVLLSVLKTLRKDETGACFKIKHKYYPKAGKKEILAALDSDPAARDWTEPGTAEESLRLDIYYSKETNTVYVHCFEFIPYEYLSCSDWYKFDLDKCGNLCK